jgi:radical SAM superfamily enzyme YgiQ (UPF0313 family)
MLGLPTETKEEVLETYSMLQEIQPYHCSPAFYTPHPGSDLFAWGQERGIHLIRGHSEYRRSTYEPKIQGPDYDFLTRILYQSMALAEDMRSPQPHAARQRLRVFLMSRHPRVYHALRRVRSFVRSRLAG